MDTGALPADRDNTDFDEFQDLPGPGQPFWMSVDIENGWIFAAISQGLQIWDATSPEAPRKVKVLGPSNFPSWAPDPHETEPVRDVDAPEGVDSVVAVVQVGEGGVALFDTSSKTRPRSVYGDVAKKAYQVYAAPIGARSYAFAATTDGGLLAYDMSAAAALANECIEETPGQQSCGVYVGRLGSRRPSYVDGAANAAATAHWVAASDGYVTEIWNVSSPTSPQLVLSGLSSSIGVALWRGGSSYYLGTRARTSSGTEARIYDVSCIASGNCNGFGAPIWRSVPLPDDAAQYFVTYSHSGNRHFLYYGSANRCPGGLQNEWLFDVTVPSQASDVTPPPALLAGQSTGYWGFYYRRNATGFNRVAPLIGKFAGSYFYRAAHSIFDIHELASGSVPVAGFTYSPSQVYRGAPVDFTDQSTGAPQSWDWSFQDGVPSSSSAQNPSGVIFTSTGAKQVSLTATNAVGSGTTDPPVTLNVLDPVPQVAGVSASPNPALLCQTVSFLAQGVTGLPPLTFAWQVRDGGDNRVDSGGDVNPLFWDTSGVAPGSYTATVTVSNGAGSDVAASPPVTVQSLPTLAFTSPGDAPETLNGPPFGSGQVELLIQADGATEWRWSFGDGTPPVWSLDPVSGPAPVHVYAAAGDYPVTVDVRNCQAGPLTSQTTTVTIADTSPLVAEFEAQGLFCDALGCFADTGVAIPFFDSSQGSPDFWDYDWQGDGSFEDPDHTSPVASHTYSASGTFTPTLRVRRASIEDTYVHGTIIVGGGSAGVAVSGPDSGLVGEALSFTAAASNCSPQPTSWSWNVGSGGTIDGPATGATVSVTYSTAGDKTVQATAANGGCNGTSGSRGVLIDNPPSPSSIFSDGFESGDSGAWSSQSP